MADDMKHRLRDLANCRHDDFTVGYEAAERIEQLEAERDELKADAMRLSWIDKALFQHQWNGVVGAGTKTYWRIAGDYRQTVAKMEGETFREAIDAAIAKKDKP